MANELGDLCTRVWRSLGGEADVAEVLTASGPRAVLPALFDVTGLPAASVACATLAAAEFLAAREVSRPRPVSVDSSAACAAFAAEGLFTPAAWSLPELWDPIAGNYRAEDGWIRLHTNYPYHRAAVERVLGADDRAAVAAAALRCAAAWRDRRRHGRLANRGGPARQAPPCVVTWILGRQRILASNRRGASPPGEPA